MTPISSTEPGKPFCSCFTKQPAWLNCRHALDTAQKLSHQLRAAEDRVAELEAEVQLYRDKADRAEQWLHKVYTEIEDRFLPQENGRRSFTGTPQRPSSRRA
jgi:hypothetical protein